MYQKASLLLLLLGLSLSGALYAQDSEPVIFEDIDTDHDGAISREEARVRMDLVNNFSEIDSNNNGTLSVDEYTAYHNKGHLVPEEVEIPEPGAAPLGK